MENDETGSSVFRLRECPYCGDIFYMSSYRAYEGWVDYHFSYLHRLLQWLKKK